MTISKRLTIILFIIFCSGVFFASRLYPLAKYGAVGMGYDTGFYRRYIDMMPTQFPGPEMFALGPDAIGTRIVLDILNRLWQNSDIALFGSYIFFNGLIGVLVFFLAKEIFKSRLAGAAAVLLFCLSGTQYLAYQYMFYKQIFATVLMLAAFYLLEKKSWWFILPAAFLAISHKTTVFIFLITLAPYFIWRARLFKKNYLLWLGAIIVGTLTFLINRETIISLIDVIRNGAPTYDLYSLQTGQFIDLKKYLELAWLYLPLGLAGIYYSIRQKLFSTAFFLSLTSVALVAFQTIFYKRLLAFVDLGLIIIAGGGAMWLWQKTANFKKTAATTAIIFVYLALSVFALNIQNQKPRVLPQELVKIKTMRSLPNDGYYMTFASKYSPWLYGWVGPDKKIISPGMFYDQWNYDQWLTFWNGAPQKQKEMLAQYHAPLYIFDPLKDYSNESCFKKLDDSVWEFTCF